MRATYPNALARTVRCFFSEYLTEQRGVSRHTTLSYRDTMILLLRFVAISEHRDPATLDLDAISPEAVLAFLNYLEQVRHNQTSSRNVRLAAIHSFFRYVATHAPERIEQAQRILGIPFKRTRTGSVDYLEEDEIRAVLNCIDRSTCYGRRDYALLGVLFNTGARAQEIVDLNVCDLQIDPPSQITLFGKGRKRRVCPLWPQTAQVLKQFVMETQLDSRSNTPLFCNQRGQRLTRFGIGYILSKYFRAAVIKCPSLASKRLHPHCARHSTAMLLLKSGVDLVTISHWLGHASVNTTNRYATADLEMKRQAIARAQPLANSLTPSDSWRQDASVIEWLASL
ncbi:site-specific integrase [Paraburkholderia sp. SIMBA_054]|uniref:site-specific integrase n=1 Tax=Paraburkholderia sp. SIMBA_054 TaxID=3085795 RepID=UPI00397DD69B